MTQPDPTPQTCQHPYCSNELGAVHVEDRAKALAFCGALCAHLNHYGERSALTDQEAAAKAKALRWHGEYPQAPRPGWWPGGRSFLA